ncbi:hypothetical protein ACPCSC_30145 [Streptomyces lavendulocolor]|uniref:hypothetical protein n=1 Tax=Streptomyces lavendulocolor TaxID=67316 RepID=UPI003C2B6BD0
MSSTATATAPAVIELTDVSDLHKHPAVKEMARDLFRATPPMLATLIGADGSPTTQFRHLANDRFREVTGESGPFLGSVAYAVIARLDEMRAVFARTEVTEAEAADLEARQAIRDMWVYGSPRCPLTKYAEKAGDHADRLAAGATQ